MIPYSIKASFSPRVPWSVSGNDTSYLLHIPYLLPSAAMQCIQAQDTFLAWRTDAILGVGWWATGIVVKYLKVK